MELQVDMKTNEKTVDAGTGSGKKNAAKTTSITKKKKKQKEEEAWVGEQREEEEEEGGGGGGAGGGGEGGEGEEEEERIKERFFQSRKVLCRKAVDFIRSKQRTMMVNTHAYYSGLLYLIIPLMTDCHCFCDLFPIAFWSVFNLQRSIRLQLVC